MQQKLLQIEQFLLHLCQYSYTIFLDKLFYINLLMLKISCAVTNSFILLSVFPWHSPRFYSVPPTISWSTTNLTRCSSISCFCCWYAYSSVFSLIQLIILEIPHKHLEDRVLGFNVNTSYFIPAYVICAVIYFPDSAMSRRFNAIFISILYRIAA